MNRSLIALALAAGLVACDDGATTTPPPAAPEMPEQPEAPETPEQPERPEAPEVPQPEDPPVETPPETPDRPEPTPVEVGEVEGGQADLMPTPPPWVPPERARRRMNIDQLDAAFRETSGGIGWTENGNDNGRNMFTVLSATLGKPDYIQITNETLEPSALFQKFLDDAARQVCARMVARDLQRGTTPILVPEDDADVDMHLQGLVLRFHGRDLPLDSPDLMHWRWLYDTVSFVAGEPADPWFAVCATLFTHPDFYSY